MKIIQFAASSDWNGELAHVFTLTRSLLERGHDVILAIRTSKHHQQLEFVRQMAASWNFPRVLELNLDSGFYPREAAPDLRRLMRCINAQGTEILHVHRGQEHWLAVLAAWLAKGRAKVVRTRHVAMPVNRNWFNRQLYAWTDQLLFTAQSIGRELDRLGVAFRRPPLWFHGGVDTDLYVPGPPSAALRAELAWPEDTIVVGGVGHLELVKGYEILIQAMREVVRAVPAARLVIAGEGRDVRRQDLLEFARRLGLEDRVALLGFRRDVPQVLRLLQCGVISSISSEGNSRTALEMLATRLPVVATRVGCLPDLVAPEETGLLVEPGKPAELAQAIIRLLTDPELAGRLARTGWERVQAEFSLAQAAEKIEQIYQALS